VVDLRASDVSPDGSDRIVTAAGADTGLHVKVGDSVMPTLGFTYFLTRQLAVVAILGSTQHTVYAAGGGASTKVHTTWVIPPVVALQYHPWPAARLSPYIGGGVNAMIYYAGDNANGFRVRLNDSVGGAVQGGFDYALKGPWALNVDVKKVFVESDAVINGGALRSNVHLDPWVISAGFGRRF
jgi:outer membrane protein